MARTTNSAITLPAPPIADLDRSRRRRFGQNFLVDEEVLDRIGEQIGASSAETVVEIGPGEGALTSRLRRARRVVAVEIDPVVAARLRRNLGSLLDLRIELADGAVVDVDSLVGPHEPAVLCGNLPYNRAGAILGHFLPVLTRFRHAVFMVQYEVARRIVASPGGRDRGALSLVVANRARADLLLKVPPEAFRPRPKVWSATVRLKPLDEPRCADPRFAWFVHEMFRQKRKTLRNALAHLVPPRTVEEAADALGLGSTARAEELEFEQVALLLNHLGPLLPSIPAQVDPGAEEI